MKKGKYGQRGKRGQMACHGGKVMFPPSLHSPGWRGEQERGAQDTSQRPLLFAGSPVQKGPEKEVLVLGVNDLKKYK